MSNSKMREEFEAWVMSLYPNQSLERFNPLHGVTEGEYTGFTVQHCWEAWQASSAALVIELPPPYPEPEEPEFGLDDSHMDAYHAANGMRHACSKFIEAAGLKVKP